MIYSVVGKEIKKGNYQGRDYVHCIVHCVCGDIKVDSLIGQRVESVKVKRQAEKAYDEISVGSDYRFYYDKFGNVDMYVED